MQVEQVGGQKTEEVDRKLPGVHVVVAQLVDVHDDETLFQIRFKPQRSASSSSLAAARATTATTMY